MMLEFGTLLLNDGDLVLRSALADDVPALYAAVVESLETLKPWMLWAHDGYQVDELRSWVLAQPALWQRGDRYELTIYDTSQDRIPLGVCGLSHFNRSFGLANLSYWVRTSRRGQGIAARAARLVARWGFEQLGLLRAEVVVAVDNIASLRVAEKCGARREGVLRNRLQVGAKIYDAVMHSLIPQDFDLLPLR